ncbi:MAG: integrase core domain-containing protein [Raoultibacter sp.]
MLRAYGIRLSIGSVGDSYDSALAETIDGAYKTELVKKFGPWECIEQLKLETARWVNWFNTKRISNVRNPQAMPVVR